MRSTTYITLFFLSISTWAQRYVDTYDPNDEEVKSILGKGNDINGFGSLDLKLTEVINERSMIVGGYGGILVNRKYMLGLGGYGLATNLEFNGQSAGETKPLNIYGGYGGMVIGGIIGSKEVIHLAIPVFLGAGSAEISDKDFFPDLPVKSEFTLESSTFLILEPAAQVEINITNNFRLAGGVSYRLVSGMKMDNMSDEDLSGTAYSLSLRFGRF